jgi:glycosyltransferase involved in cell wall biosynthesis
MVKSLKDYGNFDNVHVLPTGIDLQELDIKTTFEPRHYYQIASDSPLLLFVGRLGKEKNIQLIIRSMPKILESNPGAKLLIVGDGPYGEELKELAETTGAKQNIVFAGMLDRAKTFACFKTSDIFCFASLTDTQGLVLNEAAIVSKPIVFLDSEISPLTKDKATGILSKNSVSSFAAACNKLIDNKDLAATYGKKAKSIAMTITIDKQAKKLLKIYSDIV